MLNNATFTWSTTSRLQLAAKDWKMYEEPRDHFDVQENVHAIDTTKRRGEHDETDW